MARAFLPHLITTDSAVGGTVIERSLRFRHGESWNLQRTSENGSSTYTFSAWVKHTKLDDYKYLFSTGGAGLAFNGTTDGSGYNGNVLYIYNGSSLLESTPFLRDTNTWYHIVMKMDSGTAYTYINGAVAHNGVVGFSLNTGGNSTRIGRYPGDHEFEGYLADVHLVDGQALEPTAFAYTEDQTGTWRPKKYTGTYGTSGFHLEFKDNSSVAAFGKDTSGNGNDFSSTSFIIGDNVPDSPTNNFTLLSRSNGMAGISNAGLRFQSFNDSGGAQVACQSDRTIPNTGTWYWEIRWLGNSFTRYWGITRRLNNYTGVYWDNSGGVRYDIYNGTAHRATGGSSTQVFSGGFTGYNDGVVRILGMTVDMDQMVAKFYQNNSFVCSVSIPELPSDGKGDYVFSWVSTNGGSSSSLNDRFNFGQDSSFLGAVTNQYKTDANGIGDFYYTPPDNALALCTQNIPPNLTSSSITTPQKHFDTLLWVGSGSTKRISGLQFAPDFVWIKSRSTTRNHNAFDTMRVFGDGTKERIYPNLTNTGESSTYSGQTNLTVFHHDGFSVGSGTDTNTNTHDYVAWCWKAGGGAVANSDGTITSQVSANKDAGFSIVTYTGTGADATIGHGLGKIPACIMIKNRDRSVDWIVKHQALSAGKIIYLNLNSGEDGATGSNNGIIGDLNNASTFSLSRTNNSGNYNNVNYSGEKYVAYCWAEIPGYSKFGIYQGNGQHGNNAFADCGFEPAVLFFKKITGTDNWGVFDNKRVDSNPPNPLRRFLYPDANYAEWTGGTNDHMDFYSTGFKSQNLGSMIGGSGQKYIYMAWASKSGDSVYDVVTDAN